MSRELWRVTCNTAGDMPGPDEVHHFSGMDDALAGFVDEVKYTIEHIDAGTEEATLEDLGLSEVYDRFVENRDETLVAYRHALEGDPETDTLPAVAVEQRVHGHGPVWVHTLEKVVVSDTWYDENKEEVQ